MRTASRALTIHLALRATMVHICPMESKSRTWRQQNQNRNQESGNQAWRAERAGGREGGSQKWACATADDRAWSHRAGDRSGFVGRWIVSQQQLLHRCSDVGLSHLQTWPWRRCTGPPSLVWCSGPSRAAAPCVPRSGSCPPGDTSSEEKVSIKEGNLLERRHLRTFC